MIPNSTLKSKAAAVRTSLITVASAVLLAMGAMATAHADTITFEGYGGLVGHNDYIQSNGFDIGFYSNVAGAQNGDFVGFFTDPSDPQSCLGGACPVDNPTTYYAALNDSYVDIMNSGAGGRVQIKGFDASFIGGTDVLSTYPAISGLLRIQGFFANGSSLTETYQLAGPGAGGFNFGHYNTSAAFGSQLFTEAIFFGFTCNTAGSCSAFSSDRGQFALDNISANAVPEPSSQLLIGLGLLGMIASVRRRKA